MKDTEQLNSLQHVFQHVFDTAREALLCSCVSYHWCI